jgi:hypothetical protein
MTEVGEIWSRNLQMTPGDVAVKTEVGGIWSRNLQIVLIVCILLGEERIDGVVDRPNLVDHILFVPGLDKLDLLNSFSIEFTKSLFTIRSSF